jgi:hypothetical protein
MLLNSAISPVRRHIPLNLNNLYIKIYIMEEGKFSIFNNIPSQYVQKPTTPLINADALKGKELILFELPKGVRIAIYLV